LIGTNVSMEPAASTTNQEEEEEEEGAGPQKL
jgi:hypothetical protein